MNVDSKILNNFLKRYFYGDFENKNIELIINNKCDHSCKYCYFKPSSNLDFPITIQDDSIILENLERFIVWLEKNNFYVQISLFGGELLSQQIGHKIIDRLLVSSSVRKISVPTNMSFIFDLKLIKATQHFLDSGKVFLSASVDGKYMEENRPMRNKIERDAEYYEKLFVFCKRNNIGFHPMVYSNNVDKWIDNYRWFEQKNIKMYLLEVRNKEWNKKQTKDFCKFIEFLYLKSLDKSGTLYEKLSEENILTNDLSKSGRGIGCSIQQQLHIRLGDLTVFPCHRLMYDGMELFKFDAYFNAEPTNVELMMMIYSFNFINQPVCESCILKFACSGGCLGAQYENSKDMFMPIQEVCRLKHAKIATLIKTAKKTNTYSELLRIVSRDTNNSLRMLEQIINE